MVDNNLDLDHDDERLTNAIELSMPTTEIVKISSIKLKPVG